MDNLSTILKEILLNSLKASWINFLAAIKNFYTWLFGSAGSFFSSYKNIIDENPWHNIIGFILVSLTALFVCLLLRNIFVQTWRRYFLFKRESVYGKAIILLSEGFAKIHSLKKRKKLAPEELKAILIAFCDSIKQIYDYKTKSKCSVSIQVFISPYSSIEKMPRMAEIHNLVRDKDASKRDDENYKKTKHHIEVV